MHRNEKGITLVALIVTIIVMIILAAATIYIGIEVVSRARVEEVKTNMLAIQGRARIIGERYAFGEGELIGIEVTDPNGYFNGYKIEAGIMQNMKARAAQRGDELKFRVVFEEGLAEMGLPHITTSRERRILHNRL